MFRNKNENNNYKCTVRLLDDYDILQCEFQAIHKGIYLVEYLCEQLHIKEKDYFGIRYVDHQKQRHWLDAGKSIIKQCKDMDHILFSFRVKYYPADPFRLTGNARLMLYQQLKRDLRHGRLYCSMGEAAALGALIVQEELGDFDENVHTGDYISSMQLTIKQTGTLEKKIADLHRKRSRCQDVGVVMDEFLGIARGLETYGIDPHPVKDHRGSQLYIGINYSGMSTFVAGKRSQHFRWNEIQKINFEGKMFIAHLSYTDASREPKKHTIGFKCTSGATCRYLWRCSIEQMLFFTLPNSHNAIISGGGFFSWGTKFKYTGRTEREILTESINALREEQKKMTSAHSQRKASSVPVTPSSPQGDLAQIRYNSLPRSTMSEPLGNCPVANANYFSHNMYNPYITDGAFLEPVSEEARIKISNLSNSNIGFDGVVDYIQDFIRSDNTQMKSVFNGSQNVFHNNILSDQNAYTDKMQHTNMAKGKENTAMRNPVTNAKCIRKFHLIHAFIPSFVFAVFTLVITTILILELELDIFNRIKSIPEMKSLRKQYYQPLKEFFCIKLRLN